MGNTSLQKELALLLGGTRAKEGVAASLLGPIVNDELIIDKQLSNRAISSCEYQQRRHANLCTACRKQAEFEQGILLPRLQCAFENE